MALHRTAESCYTDRTSCVRTRGKLLIVYEKANMDQMDILPFHICSLLQAKSALQAAEAF